MNRPLLIGIALYAAYAAAMVVMHPRFIYPFQSADRVLNGFERIELTAEDGTQVALQEAAGDGPVVVYFMGNAGALTFFESALQIHKRAGRHVIAMEYRGGAGRAGQPSEAVLKSDALLVADWALSKGKAVVLHGYSLGTGLAVHVAARRDTAQVILEAPYDRLCHLMSRASFLPACLLPGVQDWSTLADAPFVKEPVLILHGASDRIIPDDRSAALEGAFSDVERQVLNGAAHFDTFRSPLAQSAVQRAFILATQ